MYKKEKNITHFVGVFREVRFKVSIFNYVTLCNMKLSVSCRLNVQTADFPYLVLEISRRCENQNRAVFPNKEKPCSSGEIYHTFHLQNLVLI